MVSLTRFGKNKEILGMWRKQDVQEFFEAGY